MHERSGRSKSFCARHVNQGTNTHEQQARISEKAYPRIEREAAFPAHPAAIRHLRDGRHQYSSIGVNAQLASSDADRLQMRIRRRHPSAERGVGWPRLSGSERGQTPPGNDFLHLGLIGQPAANQTACPRIGVQGTPSLPGLAKPAIVRKLPISKEAENQSF